MDGGAEVAAVLDEERLGVLLGELLGPEVVLFPAGSLDELGQQVVLELGNRDEGGRVGAGERLLSKAAIGEPVGQETDVLARLNVCTGLAVVLVVVLVGLEGKTLVRRLGDVTVEVVEDPSRRLAKEGGWDDLRQQLLRLGETEGVEDLQLADLVVFGNGLQVGRVLRRLSIIAEGVGRVLVNVLLGRKVCQARQGGLNLQDIEVGLVTARGQCRVR